MYYLYLEFKSASLMIDKKSKNKSTDYRRNGDSIVKKTSYEVDLETPLKVRHISNMLHCMFGLPPVSSVRDTIFTINDVIYDLALNHSYVKYDNNFFYTTAKGEKRFLKEIFWTQKAKYDSHQKTYSLIDGKKVGGNFTWENFHSNFYNDRQLFAIVIKFFNELLGCENVIKKFSFPEFLTEVKKYVNDDRMIGFKGEYGTRLNNRKVIGRNGWYEAVFEGKIITTKAAHNSNYSSPNPRLNIHGIANKVTYNGRIIVEIENESLIEDLRKYGRLPTIMDGGVINILGLKKMPPMFDWKEKFTKIYE